MTDRAKRTIAPKMTGAFVVKAAEARPLDPRWVCSGREFVGHNWMLRRGLLPWRRYRVCFTCGRSERRR